MLAVCRLALVCCRPLILMSSIVKRRALLVFITVFGLSSFASAQGLLRRAKPAIGRDVGQLVVSVAESWNSTKGTMRYFNRGRDGSWQPASSRGVPVIFGRNGLAWGRGVLVGEGDRHKREGDGRAPAGVFRLGKVYGDAGAAPSGSKVSYHQVTKWDAWVDDPKNPFYNRHVRVDPAKGVPPWFESQRMRLGDPAYRWLVEVRHNSDPPRPGAGSAIFMHVRRGPDRLTAGCTTMARTELETMIRFLRPSANPHYVLLPKSEYAKYQKAWGLPPL